MRVILAPAFLSVLLVLTSVPGAGRAQAFSCKKATSPAEALICQDKALGELDRQLFDAYHGALDTASDREALKRTQRAWLERRDACRDAACLKSLYEARLKALADSQRLTTYRDPVLGISLRLAANRTVRPCKDVKRCVEVYGRWFGHRRMLLRLKAVDGTLEQAARKEAGFEIVDGRWMTTYGRFEPVPVERFSGTGWVGMKATVTCGITVDGDFHAAAGECLWAVLSDGTRSILATTDGYEQPEETTAPMLASVVFDRP